MAKATRSSKPIEEIMASAPEAVEQVFASAALPEDVASAAVADSQNEGVAQAIRRAIEYRADPRFVRSLPGRKPRRVRLQSGEVVDLSSARGNKLFEAERAEEEKAIAARQSSRLSGAASEIRSRKLSYRAGKRAGKLRKMLPDVPVPSARNPLVRFGLRYGKNIGGMRGGLMGLGALAGGALVGKAIEAMGVRREEEAQRQEMIRRQARQDMLDMLGRKEQKQALQMSINDNLAKLQQSAPDLYMRVASGRLLPQGAVVIGGAPRQDLLNQLGMAMSNGQFSQ